MVARVAEMKAKVVEAEAQVPLALAEAFRSGRLGVMDYYKMENVKADTEMRTTISRANSTKAWAPLLCGSKTTPGRP